MTIKEIYEKAEHRLDKGEITIGEFERIVDTEVPKWIPCSERLPERDGDYLAVLHHKWPDREYKTVEVKKFRSGGFDENLYVKLVAWMPLPEPWKGADNEVLRQL